jgi:hypothetical protein
MLWEIDPIVGNKVRGFNDSRYDFWDPDVCDDCLPALDLRCWKLLVIDSTSWRPVINVLTGQAPRSIPEFGVKVGKAGE